MTSEWTTRLNPDLTRPYGVEEVHNVCFEPKDWPGKGTTIALGIPECEMFYVFLTPDGEPAPPFVNRPQRNRNVKYWLRYVCKTASEEAAFVILSCDTAEQAERAAKKAAGLLPHHHRAALERMYEGKSRARNNLS
jgi:hypothetical protein